MRLFIRFNEQGKILTAMKVQFMDESLEHPAEADQEGETVIEVELTDELKSLDCHEICEQFRVDVSNQILKKNGG